MRTLVKTLAVVAVVALVGTTSCTKSARLERTLKSNFKKELKKDRVEYQINEFTVIKLDSLPKKANEPYRNAMNKVMDYKFQYERKLKDIEFAKKWGSYSGMNYEVLKKESDSLLNLVNIYEKEADYSLKHSKSECYLTFVDYVIVAGNIPVRTQIGIIFKFDESTGTFKKITKDTYTQEIGKNIIDVLCNEEIPDPIENYRK